MVQRNVADGLEGLSEVQVIGRVCATLERGVGETIRAVLWSADLQGFTKTSDSVPRDQLLNLLHDYFGRIVETVHEHGGQVFKFVGGGVLAIFNLGSDAPSTCSALYAADLLRGRIAGLREQRKRAALPATGLYLGLHLGEVHYGNVGANRRLDFTVTGPAVNEVSRIESMCRALDQDIVISSAFAGATPICKDRLASLGRYVLRGVRRPQELFTLAAPSNL